LVVLVNGRYAPMSAQATRHTIGLAAQEDAADKGRLAGVLEIVGDHAHQPHPQRHRRIPGPVDDAIKIGIGELLDIANGLQVDRVVVAHQQRPGPNLYGRHLIGPVPVAGVPGVERQPEPLGPALGGPDLLGLGGVGEVVVLDAGQMPHQPGDRVRLLVEAEGQLLGREAATTRWTTSRILPKASTSNSALVIGGSCALRLLARALARGAAG
jgi:hypothetical protein